MFLDVVSYSPVEEAGLMFLGFLPFILIGILGLAGLYVLYRVIKRKAMARVMYGKRGK